MKQLLILIPLLLFLGCSQKKESSAELKAFNYTNPGKLTPSSSGEGRVGDKYIYAPNIRFPLEIAPAYINSQVYGVGGMHGKGGSLCDKRNYQYPWHDNYCEKRAWGMPLCPSGKGHQGVDIRGATCEKKKYYAVAVEKGKITYIGRYSVSLRGESGRTYRYLHLDSKSLQVSVGEKVKRGQRIGLVSDNMGNTKTSIHLHFDMQQTIKIDNHSKKVFVPPYSSLVEAYKRLLKGKP
ncbi:MAG: M23 family metallopeptidase [Epsilonproteobacteria bacterium]|nr:M23 family metallopeptidase [Campylobacterota bacterium]